MAVKATPITINANHLLFFMKENANDGIITISKVANMDDVRPDNAV